MVLFNDLPWELIVNVFSYLDTMDLLKLVGVCSTWREIIGRSTFNEQYGCNWFQVWTRISSPMPIVQYKYPHSHYSLYDANRDQLLLFHCRKRAQSPPIYTISAIEKPGGDEFVSFTPFISEEITNPNFVFTVEQETSGLLVHQISLSNGEIILIDQYSYFYHIEYEPFALIQSKNCYCDKAPVSSFAWCTFTRGDKECIFVCGGVFGKDKTICKTWKIYDCEKKFFVETGEMTIPRFYHSCVALPQEKILISGGKNTTRMFVTESVVQSAEIVDTQTRNIQEITMNHPRNLHKSYSLFNGDIMILGGNISAPVEKYDWRNNVFVDTEFSIPINWKSVVEVIGDKFVLERGHSRVLEIIDPYSNHLLFSSHTLPNSLLQNNAKRYTLGERILIFLQNEGTSTTFYRIPFDDLRIMPPRLSDIRSDEPIDGLIYFLDENIFIVETVKISMIYPEEILKTIERTCESRLCKYVQIHLNNNTTTEERADIIHLVTSQCSLCLFIGMNFDQQ